jgi:hypothetical protein
MPFFSNVLACPVQIGRFEEGVDPSWFSSYVICNSTGLPALVTDLKFALDSDVANIELTYPKLVQ